MIQRERIFAVMFCLFVAAFSMIAMLSIHGCTLPTPQPSSQPSPLILPKANVDSIVTGSACAKYSWKNRGRAPLGFVKGVATVFAKHACEKARPLGDKDHDALAAYSIEPTLINTYTLLLGLGMRESSGNYGEGWDKSAKTHTESGAEAGLFQFSYDSIGADSTLRPLYESYQSRKAECLLPVFREGARGNIQGVIGSGAGAEFQSLTKVCPQFAVEYAAVLVRGLRKHFGPINRKEAEFRTECQEMLQRIQEASCK